ncbi:MGH1-like glycoside hydrolase domain-containing protein [Gluconobacter potus]|uniref:MGH1-like glycoside hydrolase domain-containing protein n=1 Tax=Gluconobacter potus TaxID=2724927 RepID=UPI0039EB05DC
MIVESTVPPARAWNTWSDRPAAMTFLPLGVHVTPLLYSTSQRCATLLPPGKDLLFGRHDMGGRLVEFETRHGGTEIAFRYEKDDPYCLRGAWDGQVLAEWGLRYWLTLCLSAECGTTVTYNGEAAVIRLGYRYVALMGDMAPVQVTAHETLEAAAKDFDDNGYFHTASRGTSAPVIALRFNLEMMRKGRFAAAVADSEALATVKAREALKRTFEKEPMLPAQTGRHAGALDAVRDVMAWNTLYDGINRRPYTTFSRTWNLGTFAVWYNDQTYSALMTALIDGQTARENMAVATASATPQGNFACLATSNDTWVDRTQAPNGAFMTWMIYLRQRERSFLECHYEALSRNHMWWRRERDPDGMGLVSCGTSDVGEALYKGTHFGARNETGMDNSPTHDEAVYDPETRTLSLLDVGLNCSLALDAEYLAHIARELGHTEDAQTFDAMADDTRSKIREHLWDHERSIFANRQRHGGFVRSLGPTSFFPLICGAATPEQAQSLIEHFSDPVRFDGPYMIPNVSRDDPAFADNVYWRGRIWPNVNYFVWHGLRRYGFVAEASLLAERSMALFNQSWRGRRIAAENYSATTGEADDQPDTDLFYSWGAMLPMLGVADVMDINPWAGWELHNTGADVTLGPIHTPIGQVVVTTTNACMTLCRGQEKILSWTGTGRLTELTISDGLLSCHIHAAEGWQGILTPGPTYAARIVEIRVDGSPFPTPQSPDIDLSGIRCGQRLDLYLAPRFTT